MFLLLVYSQYTSCISCKLKKQFFPVTSNNSVTIQDGGAHGCSGSQLSSLVSIFIAFSVCTKFCNAAVSYSRQNLINLGFRHNLCITCEYQRSHNIPEEIARLPGSPWMVKRRCRSGSDARLRKQPHRPALPSLFLTNARSITHKMDELELQMVTMSFVRNCSIIFVTESWLHPLIPDAAVELAERTLHRQDKNRDSGKSRGGGLCVYVHNEWCCNSRIIDTYCSPDLEVLAVSCRPFYLPREFTVVVAIAVYIPPDANVSVALSLLLNTINKQQLAHPNRVFIVAGDQACLKTVLPKFV